MKGPRNTKNMPAGLRAYWNKKRRGKAAKSSKSRKSTRTRKARPASQTTKVIVMAAKKRKTSRKRYSSLPRKSKGRRRGSGLGGISLKNLASQSTLMSVGGVVAGGFAFGAIYAKLTKDAKPDSFIRGTWGSIAAGIAVGVGGSLLLSKVNKSAAATFAATAIGLPIIAAITAAMNKNNAPTTGTAGYLYDDGSDVAGYLYDDGTAGYDYQNAQYVTEAA